MLLFQKIKTLLSSRAASVIIFLLAATGRILHKIYYLNPAGDKASQILATKNFLAGHGFSTIEVTATALADPQYIPLIKWPPGYSLLLAPFYELSGDGYIWGSLWLDAIVAVLFVWFARKTICLFNVPAYLANFYTLITGFFLYDFAVSSSSDITAAFFYQLSLFLSLRFILSENKSYAAALLISVCLFMCGFTRYMLLPVSFIIPLYFVSSGYINRNQQFISRGYFILAALTIMTAALFVYQYSLSGSAAYVMPSEKGFYPESLLKTTPFVFSSLSNINFICVQLQNISGLPFSVVAQILSVIHLVVFAILITAVVLWLKKRKLKQPSFTEHFIYIGLFSSITTIGLLAYLSITNAEVPVSAISTWSFVYESRYFFIPILFIQLLVLIGAWQYRNSMQLWLSRLLFFCTAIIFLTLLHSIYYTAKKISLKPDLIFRKKETLTHINYYQGLMEKLIKENPGKNIVVSGVDDSYARYAGLWYNYPALADYSKLNSLQLSSTKETLLVVAIKDKDRNILTAFINNPRTHFVGKVVDVSFYTVIIIPGSQ